MDGCSDESSASNQLAKLTAQVIHSQSIIFDGFPPAVDEPNKKKVALPASHRPSSATSKCHSNIHIDYHQRHSARVFRHHVSCEMTTSQHTHKVDKSKFEIMKHFSGGAGGVSDDVTLGSVRVMIVVWCQGVALMKV